MAKTNSGLLEFKDAQKVLIALDDATSEVKKAVVIDGDGVETDIAGVQPTGKKEITSTEEVNVANYATAQVVDEDLVAGNIKKDVDILGVVGSYEGGGSSDFSTTEVTIQITTENPDVYIVIPTIVTSPTDMILNQQYNTLNSSTAQILTVPLYKEALAISGQSAGEISVNVSGSVEKVGTLDFLITGDCTITIS